MPVEKKNSDNLSNFSTGDAGSWSAVKLILLVFCFLFLGVTVWLLWIKKNPEPDQFIFESIKTFTSPGWTKFMLFITFFGNHEFLIPANLLLVFFFLLNKKVVPAVQVLFVAISSLCIMSLLKNLIQRHRPPDPLVEGITNFSYPSGHAFMSVAFYGLLIWHITQKNKNGRVEKIGIAGLIAIILLIGCSRIYLRVHYATDVVAGLSLGTLWLLFCLWWSSPKQSARVSQGLCV